MEDRNAAKMEQLIRSIKRSKPILKDPESLTDSIMERIGKQSEHKVTPMLIWIRAALSTAAALLIGLFVFQQTEVEKTTADASVRFDLEKKIEADSTCMRMLGDEHLSYIQTYLCYMQQNAIDNELFKTYPLQKN